MCARVAMATEVEGASAGAEGASQRCRPWGCGGIGRAGNEGREGRVGRQTEVERSERTSEQVGGWGLPSRANLRGRVRRRELAGKGTFTTRPWEGQHGEER